MVANAIPFYQNVSSSYTASNTTYYPILRWFEAMEDIRDVERQQQRLAWLVPQKVRLKPPVSPIRWYQKTFRGFLFAIGAK